MGAIKQALIEVDDAVCGCLNQGRTLNQTIRDLKKEFNKNGRDNIKNDLKKFLKNKKSYITKVNLFGEKLITYKIK